MEIFGFIVLVFIALFFQHLSNYIFRIANKENEPAFYLGAFACFGLSLFIIYKCCEYLIMNAAHFSPLM